MLYPLSAPSPFLVGKAADPNEPHLNSSTVLGGGRDRNLRLAVELLYAILQRRCFSATNFGIMGVSHRHRLISLVGGGCVVAAVAASARSSVEAGEKRAFRGEDRDVS